MSPRAARRNFYLSDLQLKHLNTMSKKLGLSASEILRRAIDEYWEGFDKARKRKKPPKTGGWTEGGELNEIPIR